MIYHIPIDNEEQLLSNYEEINILLYVTDDDVTYEFQPLKTVIPYKVWLKTLSRILTTPYVGSPGDEYPQFIKETNKAFKLTLVSESNEDYFHLLQMAYDHLCDLRDRYGDHFILEDVTETTRYIMV